MQTPEKQTSCKKCQQTEVNAMSSSWTTVLPALRLQLTLAVTSAAEQCVYK